jgi:mono/diheme cytochrome c family protein
MNTPIGRRIDERTGSLAALLAAALIAFVGCGDDAEPAESASDSASESAASPDSASTDDSATAVIGSDLAALRKRGKVVYNTNCIACHHRDPAQDGGLGPPVAGASRDLLEARILRAEYPAGYTPKAETGLMIPLPHLEPELDALAAFLAESEPR